MMQKQIKHLQIASVCFFIAALLCLCLCSCGRRQKANSGVQLNLTNTADNLSVLSVSWKIDGNPVGTTAVEIAGGGKTLGKDTLSFQLLPEDVEKQADLQKLSVTVKVTESGGQTVEAGTLRLPSKFGDQYDLELRYEDGCYGLWMRK